MATSLARGAPLTEDDLAIRPDAGRYHATIPSAVTVTPAELLED